MGFNGFGGGGNMANLMKQAQQMQKLFTEAQEKLAEEEVVGSASGGLVEVTMNKTIVGVKIKPEIVDKDDVEMLEDMILAAINDAQVKAEELSQKTLGPLGGAKGLL